MKKIIKFVKKETVLTIAWILAIISAFFIHPSLSYFDYIDWRSLGILWGLMAIMQGLKNNGVFEAIGWKLLDKTKKVWQLSIVLVFLCFVTSMFITNDVALITFVPFTVMMLINCNKEDLMIPIIVLQTIAANLGSMLTPIGNPQNLYLYGLSELAMGDFILYMLPFSVASAVLLIISIFLLKGRNDAIKGSDIPKNPRREIKENDKTRKKNLRITSYFVLFILALLVVARVIPYYILVLLVIITLLILEKNVLIQVDYALLFTFIGFFIFTGNMGNITFISDILSSLVKDKEILIGVLASQCISNVPAALLLSGFTTNYKALLLGVNLGGLGTLIASMASLISYKFYVNQYPSKKGKYMLCFTLLNLLYLIILSVMAYFLV